MGEHEMTNEEREAERRDRFGGYDSWYERVYRRAVETNPRSPHMAAGEQSLLDELHAEALADDALRNPLKRGPACINCGDPWTHYRSCSRKAYPWSHQSLDELHAEALADDHWRDVFRERLGVSLLESFRESGEARRQSRIRSNVLVDPMMIFSDRDSRWYRQLAHRTPVAVLAELRAEALAEDAARAQHNKWCDRHRVHRNVSPTGYAAACMIEADHAEALADDAEREQRDALEQAHAEALEDDALLREVARLERGRPRWAERIYLAERARLNAESERTELAELRKLRADLEALLGPCPPNARVPTWILNAVLNGRLHLS